MTSITGNVTFQIPDPDGSVRRLLFDMPESDVIMAAVTITDEAVSYDIAKGTDALDPVAGTEPYGAGSRTHFTVESAWRAVDKALTRFQVEETYVYDERSEGA